MMASNGTEETLTHYFSEFKKVNPGDPKIIMSDRDQAQINAAHFTWNTSMILLCWWHVLHDWRKYIKIGLEPETWKNLKLLLHACSDSAFDPLLEKIRTASPDFFVYLNKNWLPGAFAFPA